MDSILHPEKQRSLEKQLEELDAEQRSCFDELKTEWNAPDNKNAVVKYSDYEILRFARNSPGKTKFNPKTARKVMVNYAKWSKSIGLDRLTIHIVRKQLEREVFCIPGTRTKEGHLYLYMRPSYFFPRKDSLDELMRALVYMLERMTELEESCKNGIAVMCNMDGWGMSNFGVKYASTYFWTMQGRFPMRVRAFLIANPPSWFSKIWKIIRPMMSHDFAAKVAMPKGEKVLDYVDSIETLPKEFGGKQDTREALDKFIKRRYQIEGLDYDADYQNVEAAPKMTAPKASEHTET